MKKVNKAWDDIYQNSTINTQTLRDNAAKFSKDNLSLKIIKVRDGNGVEPGAIHIRAIETRRVKTISKK